MPVVLYDKIIISDTSCLIGFTNIGKLEILHDLCREITITPEIAREYGELLPDQIRKPLLMNCAWYIFDCQNWHKEILTVKALSSLYIKHLHSWA
jgi:predicted nucleic acid-binding protein